MFFCHYSKSSSHYRFVFDAQIGYKVHLLAYNKSESPENENMLAWIFHCLIFHTSSFYIAFGISSCK